MRAETSRESVSYSSMRAPRTPGAEDTPKYDVHRQVSRIPMPTPAHVSKAGPFPSPSQPLNSSPNEVSSFAVACDESASVSTIDPECGSSQRQPSCASASSVDLDSASGREGVLFDGGMQSPSVLHGCHSDMKSVPQSPMVSASAGGSASPDSMPDSAYTGSETQTSHPRVPPAKHAEIDADSVASLGSFLDLEDVAQQTPPGSMIPQAPAVSEIQPSQRAAEGIGFTFSAVSATPTHGAPNLASMLLTARVGSSNMHTENHV